MANRHQTPGFNTRSLSLPGMLLGTGGSLSVVMAANGMRQRLSLPTFEAACYCLDAPEWIPAGSAVAPVDQDIRDDTPCAFSLVGR